MQQQQQQKKTRIPGNCDVAIGFYSQGRFRPTQRDRVTGSDRRCWLLASGRRVLRSSLGVIGESGHCLEVWEDGYEEAIADYAEQMKFAYDRDTRLGQLRWRLAQLTYNLGTISNTSIDSICAALGQVAEAEGWE